MIDLRQSPQFGKYTEAIGWQTEKIGDCQVFIRQLPLIGSIIKIQRPNSIPFKKIDELAKRYRALFVKIEPIQQLSNKTMKQLKSHGFRQDSWPLLPTKTIWIDLTKTANQLWKEMEKETRYCVKKAEENNLTIGQLSNRTIDKFYKNFKKFGKGYIPKRDEFQALNESLGKNAILLSLDGLAGTLILIADQTAYYYYAFSSSLGRKKFAQHLLIWEAIKLAKSLKCQIFDLEGIEDSRYKVTRKWRGFSHFKKSFGGKEIAFPGSFTKYYHPIAKLLFPRLA